MSKIERSNATGRFAPAEFSAEVRISKAFWASPEGKARKAKLDQASRSKRSGIRFPELAKQGTKPSINSTAIWERRLARLSKSPI
jgi:hypothetical protein